MKNRMRVKTLLLTVAKKILPESTVLSYSYMLRNKKPRLKIMTQEESISYIEKTGCSIARFGDGEFELLLWPDGKVGFQEHNDELARRLKEVLASEEEKLLVCIPYALNDIRGRTDDSIRFWYYWCERDNQRKLLIDLISSYHTPDYVFGDTQISRPYIAWKTSKNADIMFPRLMNLWKDKDIMIVEGAKTRLGVGNDLFSSARSIKRVLGPATNAFDHIDEIEDKVMELYQGELVIMALGPTATIMALDLSRKGVQALDVGHLDIEYEWYKRGSKSHELIPGKYTNEATNGNEVDECEDGAYLSQIVARI